MKRIFALILAAVMILAAVPVMGTAEASSEINPIVGAWYYTFTTGSMVVVAMYIFDPTGAVAMIPLTIGPGAFEESSAMVIPLGRWEQDATSVYSVTGTGVIDGPAFLNGDKLYLYTRDENAMLYYRIRPYDEQAVYTTQEILQMIMGQ